MPKERLTMRKIKEVLRLKYENALSDSKIANSCCIARSTVANYISKSQQMWGGQNVGGSGLEISVY